jgi:hypothetical protein
MKPINTSGSPGRTGGIPFLADPLFLGLRVASFLDSVPGISIREIRGLIILSLIQNRFLMG